MERSTHSALEGEHTEYIYSLSSFLPDYDLESCIYRALGRVLVEDLADAFSQLPLGFGLKFNFNVQIKMVKESPDPNEQTDMKFWFNSNNRMISDLGDPRALEMAVRESLHEAFKHYDTFVQTGSGWVFKKLLQLKLCIYRFRFFSGGCLRAALPPPLRAYRCILSLSERQKNIARDLGNCFLVAVMLALGAHQKTRNVTRLNRVQLKWIRSMNLKGPTNLRDIILFEKQTPSLSINVFGYESGGIVPMYVSPKLEGQHIDLLLHNEHYYAITNLASLVRGVSGRSNRRGHFMCRYCLSFFTSKAAFELHLAVCTRAFQVLKTPLDSQRFCKFTNFGNLLEVPFVIYADLESSISSPVSSLSLGTKQIATRQHDCIAWSCITVCRPDPELSSEPKIYVGEGSLDAFFDFLQEEYERISDILCCQKKDMLPLTAEQYFQHQEATHCAFCLNEFDLQRRQKCYDHCHITGLYRMALCKICNLTRAKEHGVLIPIFFHGLMNYDSHFLVQKMHKFQHTKIIPRNSEKFLALRFGPYFLKDSYQFLGESLAVLAQNLQQKGELYFRRLRSIFPRSSEYKLLLQKGIFPYNYISSLDVLSETTLPPKNEFYNDLTRSHVSDEEYQFAQRVWNQFECKTLEDYLKVYLMTDVLLLADCFENFRDNCLRDYELDPVRYFSLAHFTFDAFLRKSQAQLELFTDVNQYLFVNSAIRGGLSMVSKRFSQANNKYLHDYDPEKSQVYLLYLDCNNLYGKCMTDFLPVGNFEWVKEKDFPSLLAGLLSHPLDADVGYILECDLEYPKSLHDWHADYPLAPERKSVPFRCLSPYAQQLCLSHGLKGSTGTEKLLTTLEDKQHYILHYKNLQLYLKLGMRLSKVHNILSFQQRPVIRDYILFNSWKRAQATNSFDVNLYKLISNALFGKTIERPDNKTIVKLVSDLEKYHKYVSKPTFKSAKIINSDLVSVELKQAFLKIEKPTYLGVAILDFAKYYMYDFHYNVMKEHFGNRISLLYTDTDSFIYEIQSPDVYQELRSLREYFDFSNYPSSHFLFSDEHKKVPGLFKDECASVPIEKFIGLRSKMYCLKQSQGTELKLAKGVRKSVIQNDLRCENYEKCLFEQERFEHEFHMIKSVRHHVSTSHQSKISLSPFDDKRWLLDCVESLPYGHYRLDRHDDDDDDHDDETATFT